RIEIEDAEHAARVQDRKRDHGAKRELAHALAILEERGADRVGNPDGFAAVRRLFGDAPRDLKFLRPKRPLLAAARDLEVQLSVLAHEHQEPTVGARDLHDGVDDAREQLVEIERARDLTAREKDVIHPFEIGAWAGTGRSARLREELTLPLRESPTQ